jgi:prepilin-type N-terminal cleavage/methylation domain-containing protein
MSEQMQPRPAADSGFTLVEVMVTTIILLTVSGVVISGVLDMMQLGTTTTNRSAMFAAVRNATALLQQEVGQAGRVTLTGGATLTNPAAAGLDTASVSLASNMFVGEYLVIGTGSTQETVAVSQINGTTLTLSSKFEHDHLATEPVTVQGAFQAGVVPKHKSDGTVDPNGSSDTVLKIFGDINGSGKMVYVEYTCDLNEHVLYRNQMDFDAGAKAVPGVEEILVENVQANPGNAPCFTYQEETIANNVFVIGVAITLTVRSEEKDPITKKYQQESKALLNVSPRNVFNAWQMYSLQLYNRVQPTPPATAALMPALP